MKEIKLIGMSRNPKDFLDIFTCHFDVDNEDLDQVTERGVAMMAISTVGSNAPVILVQMTENKISSLKYIIYKRKEVFKQIDISQMPQDLRDYINGYLRNINMRPLIKEAFEKAINF